MTDQPETDQQFFCRRFRDYYILKRPAATQLLTSGQGDVLGSIAVLYYNQIKGVLPRDCFKAFLDEIAVEEKMLVDASEFAAYARRFMRSKIPAGNRDISDEVKEMLRNFASFAEESQLIDRKIHAIRWEIERIIQQNDQRFAGVSREVAYNNLLALLAEERGGMSGIDASDVAKVVEAKEHALAEIRRARQQLNEQHGRQLTDSEFRYIYFGRLLSNIGIDVNKPTTQEDKNVTGKE